MRKPEQRFWDRITENRKKTWHPILLERIENVVGSGHPDVHALCNGKFWPIELKAVASRPARADTPLLGNSSGLNVQQRNWHLDWQRHGGESYFAVACGPREVFLVEGKYFDHLNKMSYQHFERDCMFKGTTLQLLEFIGKFKK